MNLPELQRRFQGSKILVIGDLMLDEYLIGSVSRISPEAPVPVLDVKDRKHVAGGAANVAANIRSMGGTVTLLGIVCEDAAGQTLRGILLEWGIRLDGLVDGGARGTISKTRIVAGQQQIVRIDHEDRSPLTMELQNRISNTAASLIAEHDLCIVSDYAKGLLTSSVCAAVVTKARELAKPVIVDPKGKAFGKYEGCTVITPNLHEAADATGLNIDDQTSLYEAGARLCKALPGSRILITRGADGMTLFQEGATPFTVPALARRVFDVVGAGDTVVATLALALASNIPLHTAMKLSSVAASIAVSKPGTATVTVNELFENEDYYRVMQQNAALA